MISFSRLLVAGACALSLSPAALAGNSHATSADAAAMLDKAVAELQAVGPDKAFTEFNQAEGPFHGQELYVFVFDMKGVYEAYGPNPALVGTDVSGLTDVEGKAFVQEMLNLAAHDGSGKVAYKWLNRSDNRVEQKWSLIRRVGNHVVGVGYHPG